jgi:transcriptional regulator with PAS, ATPase and Fis domain
MAIPGLASATQAAAAPFAAFTGRSAAAVQLLTEARRVAETNARVLITGESGSGKELIASYIHAWSSRHLRPFIAVNCAALSDTLLESELFGHLRGSFTGAYRDKRGKFEQAHTGTLFLDEIAEMSLRMQGLLLRVLETGELQKVGEDRQTTRVDCRIIAATNRSLPQMVQAGTFREDLYYRLDVIHLQVPPLRERREDIPLLVDAFLERADVSSAARRLEKEVYRALGQYDWPGNVRQLENVVQRLVLNARHDMVTVGDLPATIRHDTAALLPVPRVERRRTAADALYDRLRAGESFWTVVRPPFLDREITRADVRALLRKALEEAGGNYRVVTRLFNVPMDEYKRLLNFLRKHDCLLPYRDFR